MSGLVCNCLSTVMASYWHCRITVTSSGNNVLNHLVLFVSARVILYSTFSFHCCLNMFTQVQMSTIAQVFLYQFYPFLNLFSLGCLPVSYHFFFINVVFLTLCGQEKTCKVHRHGPGYSHTLSCSRFSRMENNISCQSREVAIEAYRI